MPLRRARQLRGEHHAEIITITGRSYRLKDRAASTPDAAKAAKPRKKTKTVCQEQKK